MTDMNMEARWEATADDFGFAKPLEEHSAIKKVEKDPEQIKASVEKFLRLIGEDEPIVEADSVERRKPLEVSSLRRLFKNFFVKKNNYEKSIDKYVNSATITSKKTQLDGGPGSGNHGHAGTPGQRGGSARSLSSADKAKISKRFVGQKTHDGIEITSFSVHAFDRIGGRRISPGRIDKMVTTGETSPGHTEGTQCYDIPGSRLVLNKNTGTVVTVMWRGRKNK